MSQETALVALNSLKVSLAEFTAKERVRLSEEAAFLEIINTSASTLVNTTSAETTDLISTDINRLLGL